MDLARHDFKAIGEQYGTPFYLYDIDAAADHLKVLQQGLPENTDVLYCVKANPNPKIIEMYRDLTSRVDLSSGGEIELALAAGWQADAMSLAGPGKTTEELQLAISKNIGSLSIESIGELRRAAKIAEEIDTTVQVLLRINPQSVPAAFAMKMGGVASQFGIPEEEIDEVIETAKRLRSIQLQGFHIFSGTQCLKLDAAMENVRQTLETSERLASKHDLELEEVNVGGGVGVAYFPREEDVPPGDLSHALSRLITEFRRNSDRLRHTRVAIELGRYLIARFGVYVAQVTEVKQSRNKHFAILNGGMNHCFPATGNFGQLIKKNYPVANLSRKVADEDLVKTEIVGPLCTPLDSMARSLLMAPAEVDDLVAFENCGAYSFSASPLMFLSHKTPIELVYRHGEISVARRRLSMADFV